MLFACFLYAWVILVCLIMEKILNLLLSVNIIIL